MPQSYEGSDWDDDTSWQVVAQHDYNPDSIDDLATVIIEAVADAEGVDSMAIKEPHLYDVVDVSAVEGACFNPKATDDYHNSNRSIEFEYRDLKVTVQSDGWVLVAEPTVL